MARRYRVPTFGLLLVAVLILSTGLARRAYADDQHVSKSRAGAVLRAKLRACGVDMKTYRSDTGKTWNTFSFSRKRKHKTGVSGYATFSVPGDNSVRHYWTVDPGWKFCAIQRYNERSSDGKGWFTFPAPTTRSGRSGEYDVNLDTNPGDFTSALLIVVKRHH
jgi:hypothetical protein